MGFRQWEAVTPEMFQKFHNKFPEKIENLKKLMWKKSINFPISQRNWKFKNTKNKFYINFWKKAWGGKDKFP